jgi:hypothetical protein
MVEVVGGLPAPSDLEFGEDIVGAADHPVGGSGHLVEITAGPSGDVREAIASAVEAKACAHHVGDGLGFHLDDAPTVGTGSRRRFVKPDMGKLVNGSLETLGTGETGADHDLTTLVVSDPVRLPDAVRVCDL